MTKSHDIVERLRLFGSSAVEREAADEIERLRAERDEARQRLCKVVGDNRDMWGEDVAKEYGWDCFKEPAHAS